MLEIRDFTVEYRQKPLGIDVKAPRFSWKLCSDQQNVNVNEKVSHMLTKF